jgi:hypothetical protein
MIPIYRPSQHFKRRMARIHPMAERRRGAIQLTALKPLLSVPSMLARHGR